MFKIARRSTLRSGAALVALLGAATLLSGCDQPHNDAVSAVEPSVEALTETKESNPLEGVAAMQIQYLEIVTPEVDALVRRYSTIYNITFSEPDANFGGARTAELNGGGVIGIRGPLRDTETPVVRPYVLVDDINAAVEAAAEAGAEIAVPPMEIPGQGLFAIVIQGGIESGFWQK